MYQISGLVRGVVVRVSVESLPVTRMDYCLNLMPAGDAWLNQLAAAVADTAVATVGDAARALRELDRLRNRMDSIRLRLIATIEVERVPERTGLASTGQWVARTTATDSRRAATQAGLAGALGNQPIAPPPAAPADETVDGLLAVVAPGEVRSLTGVALDAGEISADHATVIMNALADLPAWLTDEQRHLCETKLLQFAANRAPGQLRLHARRILEVVVPPAENAVVDEYENTLLAAEEEHARAATSFWLKDNQDGTCTGHFTIPTLAGHMLKKMVDAMTAPRRHTVGLPQFASERDRAEESRLRAEDWRHRRGMAFTELLEHLPTEHLSDRVGATVIITTRLDDLQEQLVRAGHTDTGHKLSAGEVRRLACGAGLLPAVMGGPSVPVDLGRQTRCYTPTQKAALATAYTECATDGCDRPFAWSEIHHETPWATGGSTDLTNAIPLCSRHHHLVHQGHDHTIHRNSAGIATVRFHRRT